MASNRMTPVAAAKALVIRPQVVYGYIKGNRVSTYANPIPGKPALVDLEEVRNVASSTQHHRAKDPTTGKPIKPKAADAGLVKGAIVSYHAKPARERKPRAHRVRVVTQVIKDESGDDSQVRLAKGEHDEGITWDMGYITDKVAKQACMIEPPGNLLAVLMYHWSNQGRPDLAAALQVWCETNEVDYGEVKDAVT